MKDIILPNFVLTIIEKLQSYGFVAYVAGGCVRDLIMNKDPSDYDIATSAKPDQVIESLFPLYIIETGIKHGTVTVIINNNSVEVTTFRSDGNYLDNRRPESVSFDAGLFEDTSRRDFTINAMMYSPDSGIIDHHGGLADIKNKIVRCVGNADDRFNEDALRILRALRFASVLSFDIEQFTAVAALKNKHLLQNISAERKTIELKKLLCGVNAKKIIIEFFEIIQSLIPGLNTNKEHIASVINSCPNKDYLRLAVLLHYSDEFTLPKSLTLDNISKNQIKKLTDLYDTIIPVDKTIIKSYLRKLSSPLFFDLLELKLAEAVVSKKSTENIIQIKEIVKQILDNNECFTLSMLAIDGNDLIKNNIANGKEIGLVLELLLDSVVKERVQNEKQALIHYATTLI